MLFWFLVHYVFNPLAYLVSLSFATLVFTCIDTVLSYTSSETSVNRDCSSYSPVVRLRAESEILGILRTKDVLLDVRNTRYKLTSSDAQLEHVSAAGRAREEKGAYAMKMTSYFKSRWCGAQRRAALKSGS